MKNFGGKVLFLDRSDINTDEIMPARYLTEITKAALKPFLLEDLKMEGFDARTDITGKRVVITRENFGCGSSREHAPWGFEVNDITVVIAESYARIFRQNMYNCGLMALELPKETMDKLFAKYAGKETEVEVNVADSKLTFKADGQSEVVEFKLEGFDRALVEAGGWIEYADAKY